jgi:hypothetical protein
MRDNLRMPEPQHTRRYFTPWTANDVRGCWTCAHATGCDGVHLWCERFRLVVIDACGSWERGAGCDEREPRQI